MLTDKNASSDTDLRKISELGKQDCNAGLRLNGGYGSGSSNGSMGNYPNSSGGYLTVSNSPYNSAASRSDGNNYWNWNDSFGSGTRKQWRSDGLCRIKQ